MRKSRILSWKLKKPQIPHTENNTYNFPVDKKFLQQTTLSMNIKDLRDISIEGTTFRFISELQ